MSDGPSKSQLLIYQSDDGTIKIDVRFENETVWLTQQLMAELFQTTKQNIGQHLKNTFDEGELAETSVVKKFFTTAVDGKNYQTNFYNLDAIISVGYRVKSRVATQFRTWATHAGKISHELALSHAEQEYDTFHRLRLAENAQLPDDFEKTVQQLPAAKPKRKKGSKA
jgi:hypothetical protein